MAIDRQALEGLDREALLAEALRHGIKRPEVMTRVELTDEILRLGTPNPVERKQVRGWLGVARDLVASVVDKGLNLPDAAAVIRGDVRFEPLKTFHAPVATVTLAEIYGAQGHHVRAIGMLDEVLDKEPEHDVARRLRQRLELVRDRRGAADEVARRAMGVPDPEPAAVVADAVEADVSGGAGFVTADLQEDLDDAGADPTDDPDVATLPPRADYSFREGINETPVPEAGSVEPPPLFDLDAEDGETETLPPVHAETAAVLQGDDEEGALTRFPAALQADEADDDQGDDDDDDGTLATLPPLNDDDADGTSVTLPPAGAHFTEAPPGTMDSALVSRSEEQEEPEPKTLAPLQREAPDAPAFEAQENPVKRVAPSDVDWEPLPQTELAPPVIDAPPAAPPVVDDAVVVVRTSDSTASLYFELGTVPDRQAVVRVVELRPRPSFAERIERELPVTSRSGLVTIADLERGSIVRAAIGVREGDLFRALAVAAEVRPSAAGPEIVWAPRSPGGYSAVARNASLVLPPLRP